MHNYSILEEEIGNAVWFFEELEGLRSSCDRRLTHLAKRRLCSACGAYYYPRIARKKCPECDSKLRSVEKVMTCPNCGYQAGELGCRCGEKDRWTPAPKDDPYVRRETIPLLRQLEDRLEVRVIELVREHPLWEWTKRVKGLGETTIARIISRCDIERCTTLSKFFAHFGQGLKPDGTIQRKKRGVKLDYDPQAQSVAYMMAKSLQSQRDSYSDFYLDWKDDNKARGLSDGLANSRAFRNMRKLALSNIYEIWRKGVGLPYSEPYCYTILVPPHSIETKISPWQMTKKPEPSGKHKKGGDSQC